MGPVGVVGPVGPGPPPPPAGPDPPPSGKVIPPGPPMLTGGVGATVVVIMGIVVVAVSTSAQIWAPTLWSYVHVCVREQLVDAHEYILLEQLHIVEQSEDIAS